MINKLKADIAKNIRIALAGAGMKQKELSAKTGITQQTITNYISAKTYPDLFTLTRMAGAMNTTPKELLPSWYLNTTMNNPREKE